MHYDPEQDMYKALAEILNVNYDIIELIEPIIGENNGSSKDEWHYGYYFEIPSFESLDDETQEEVRKWITVNDFPFGETIYLSDGELSNTWHNDYEAEEYYRIYILPKERVIEELDSISEKMKIHDDNLIIKALLFSAFSITESYTRSLIWKKIPNFDNDIPNEILNDVLKKHLFDKLSRGNGRKEIYKKFTGKELAPIPHYNPIRNSLAHDIGIGQVIHGKIKVKGKNNEESEEDINKIIKDLQNYILNLAK